MIRLSIIIPMYNVEPYVERCIRSIENQDIPQNEYEVICINDGSPDNAREVVIRLQEEFNNIVLIEQENRGVSAARNRGIKNARGKYLLMVDPDDFLKPNFLSSKLEYLDQNNLEIGISGYIILSKALEEVYTYDPPHDQSIILSGVEYYDEYHKGTTRIRDPHRSWAIFFRTSFFNANDLEYLEDVPYLEDGELMARAMCSADRVAFINGPYYMRTTRPGSATHSRLFYSEKARIGFLKAANNLLNFKLTSCKDVGQKVFMNQPIIHFTLLSVTSIPIIDYPRYYSKIYNNLKTGPLKSLDLEGSNGVYNKMARYYNRSIHSLYFHWNLFILKRSMKLRLKRNNVLFKFWKR